MKTLSEKQKWIYSSSAIALFSMFLPWFVWGMRSDNGWETNYYVLLACWFLPLISAYNYNNWKVINRISILFGSLAFVAFFGDRASIRLLGETYTSNVGAGAYVYLLAWSAAVYSELMVSNETHDANDVSGNSTSASVNEELFLKVASDFENNKIDEALWVKSLTLCDGDKDKAKFKYIRDKVNKLEQELNKNNKTKIPAFRNIIEEFKNKISVIDNDEALKKSKYSLVLGVLSILCVIGIVIFAGHGFNLIFIPVALIASIGGLILGMINIKNKQGVSKRISIYGIVMSGMVLSLFLSVIVFAIE